jgi:hypothetical protein
MPSYSIPSSPSDGRLTLGGREGGFDTAESLEVVRARPWFDGGSFSGDGAYFSSLGEVRRLGRGGILGIPAEEELEEFLPDGRAGRGGIDGTAFVDMLGGGFLSLRKSRRRRRTRTDGQSKTRDYVGFPEGSC